MEATGGAAVADSPLELIPQLRFPISPAQLASVIKKGIVPSTLLQDCHKAASFTTTTQREQQVAAITGSGNAFTLTEKREIVKNNSNYSTII